jgi:hypothetical protein
MTDAVIITGVSIILLLALFGVFLYYYLYFLEKEIINRWLDIKEKLNLRLDKIPMIIDILRRNQIENPIFNELISERAELWPLHEISKQRVQGELHVSHMLKQLFDLGKTESISKDMHFLSQKKEIKELGQEIEELSEHLNEKVRAYNSKIDFVLLKPLANLLRFNRLPLFEFEP